MRFLSSGLMVLALTASAWAQCTDPTYAPEIGATTIPSILAVVVGGVLLLTDRFRAR